MTSPGSSLLVSFLLVPDGVPAERWPWLPLLTGLAAAEAVRRVAGVEVGLKWPNDVLADGRKLGRDPAGAGRARGDGRRPSSGSGSTAAGAEELPVPEATSLALVAEAPVDRTELLEALVEELGEPLRRVGWAVADVRERYLSCASRRVSRCGSPCPAVR